MRTTWNDAKIIAELQKIAACSDYMPTANSLVESGRNDLSCAISRRGGWSKFSKLINKPLTPSDTLTGWNGEAAVYEWLNSMGYSVERQVTRAHFDILVNGLLRIDVKAASFADYGASTGWFYRMGKVISADVVICARMDKGDFYVFPWFRVPSTNLTITPTGRAHANYQMNTGVISEMLKRKIEESELFPECKKGV